MQGVTLDKDFHGHEHLDKAMTHWKKKLLLSKGSLFIAYVTAAKQKFLHVS